MDDVLAHTPNWETHIQVLRVFFERVRNANLSLRPSKCEIGYSKIDFLGQTIVEDSLVPNVKNLEKIIDAARPATKSQLKSFLGLVGFYKSFISHYSDLTAPLTDLLKKVCPDKLRWGSPQEAAFQNLKGCLTKEPVLKLPVIDREFTLRTDASGVAVAAVLLQLHDGRLHPVSFASKKLSPREARYPISELETLGIVFGVQKYHSYLYATHFVIETDHKPLEILTGGVSSNNRIMRWCLALQAYNYTIRYIKGEDNLGADFFSRHFNSPAETFGAPVGVTLSRCPKSTSGKAGICKGEQGTSG